MEQIVIYLSMIKILLSLKQKILKFVHIQIYYAQETFQKIGQKIIGLEGYVYNFSADYNTIATSDIVDIHKYLMKKNRIV